MPELGLAGPGRSGPSAPGIPYNRSYVGAGRPSVTGRVFVLQTGEQHQTNYQTVWVLVRDQVRTRTQSQTQTWALSFGADGFD